MPDREGSRLTLAVLGAWVLLLVASPALDMPLGRVVGDWGGTAWGHFWAEAAYWAGQGWAQGVAMALMAVAGWRLGRPGFLRTGLAGVAAVIASGLLAQLIKHLVGRPRPRMDLSSLALAGPTLDSDFHSFPSGHAATSFALAVVLARRFPRWSWLFYSLAALVSLGRVVGGSHYLSDILAGAMVGLLSGLVMLLLIPQARRDSA